MHRQLRHFSDGCSKFRLAVVAPHVISSCRANIAEGRGHTSQAEPLVRNPSWTDSDKPKPCGHTRNACNASSDSILALVTLQRLNHIVLTGLCLTECFWKLETTKPKPFCGCCFRRRDQVSADGTRCDDFKFLSAATLISA